MFTFRPLSLTSILLAAMMSVLVGTPLARAGGVTFTADAVQAYPNGTVQRGRIFVADEGMRFESGAGPRHVVQIVLPTKKITRVLFPADKTYMEYEGAGTMPTDRPSTPCPAHPSMTCDKAGTDTLDDIETVKYKVLPAGAKEDAAVYLWWDDKRKMVLRQEFPDGRIMQMTQQGTEDYDGRAVERWETAYMSPNGQMARSVQLFDAALGLAVREMRPDGTKRRLMNIQEVTADPAWFAVPDGFRKIDPRVPPQKGAPAQ